MIWAVTAPIMFCKTRFLLISENEFFHELKCNGMTGFVEFILLVIQLRCCSVLLLYVLNFKQHSDIGPEVLVEKTILHYAISNAIMNILFK